MTTEPVGAGQHKKRPAGRAGRSRLGWALLVLGVASAALPISASAARPEREARGGAVIEGRYIVVYERSVDAPAAKTARLERAKGIRSSHRYGTAIKGFAAQLSAAQVRSLRADPQVASLTADRRVEASDYAPLASGEPMPPAGIRRVGAATASSARRASGANVAVIDTGVDLAHPDLNAASGKNCVSPGTPARDDNGHGTHVAGTIAGRNDGAGVTGVAPDTRLYAAKVLDGQGSGTMSQVICGIDWVTSTRTDADPSNDVSVANMSLGGPGPAVQSCATTTDPQHKAICNSTAAGVTYVVAAGNDGWDFDYARQPDLPAAYPEVLTVTAMGDSDGRSGGTGGAPACWSTQEDDRYASFSSFAATAAGREHTIAAPGVCIESTWPGGGYATESGTSMATPHVAGATVLCLEEAGAKGPCAGLSPAQIVQRMRSDAASHSAVDGAYGFGGDPTRPVSSGAYFGHLLWAGSEAPDTQAPTVASVSPADTATGVGTSAEVTVTFSEAMDRSAAEAAFALVRTSDGARVSGSYSWSANTMTFRPGAPLSHGEEYTATVAAGARDTAGNTLSAEKAWSFRTLASVTAYPSATILQSGSLRSGGYAQLGSDDNAYYSVNSTTSGTRTGSWYGKVTGVSNNLGSLAVSYKGKSSRSCNQTVSLWRWTTSSWVVLDSRAVSTTEVPVDKALTSGLSDYVSGTSGDGEVRLRVRCTSSSWFYSSADAARIVFERP